MWAGLPTSAPGKVPLQGGGGWGSFLSIFVAPPPSVSLGLWNFSIPGHSARLVIRLVCMCMFLLSVLEKLRYSGQICQQLFLLSQKGGSKSQPLTFQH